MNLTWNNIITQFSCLLFDCDKTTGSRSALGKGEVAPNDDVISGCAWERHLEAVKAMSSVSSTVMTTVEDASPYIIEQRRNETNRNVCMGRLLQLVAGLVIENLGASSNRINARQPSLPAAKMITLIRFCKISMSSLESSQNSFATITTSPAWFLTRFILYRSRLMMTPNEQGLPDLIRSSISPRDN